MRKGFAFQDGRAVYECVDAPSRCIWYTTPYWYLGQAEDVKHDCLEDLGQLGFRVTSGVFSWQTPESSQLEEWYLQAQQLSEGASGPLCAVGGTSCLASSEIDRHVPKSCESSLCAPLYHIHSMDRHVAIGLIESFSMPYQVVYRSGGSRIIFRHLVRLCVSEHPFWLKGSVCLTQLSA